MNITLSHMQALDLADRFARTVECENTTMKLRATWGLCPGDTGPCIYSQNLVGNRSEEFREMQAGIKSIQDPFERWEFIRTLRFCFNQRMTTNRQDRKWQDYYASVARVQAELATERRAA